MNINENIIPEAGNLYSALRNSGYSNIAAIGDLVDNSLDAGASVIKIDIANNLKQIFLSDNGTGMTLEDLNQALKLGGRKPHNNANDLGKYGLGLITASISMGTKLKVITRKDGKTVTGSFDVDEVRGTNKFIANFRESNELEINSFDYRTDYSSCGTVLLIDNCDKIQYSTLDSFIVALKEYIESAFWAFIDSGRKIMINDISAVSKDPLQFFDKRTKVWVDKTIEIPLPNGGTEKLDILAVMLNDFGKGMNRKMGINIENQGFYVLRNNREISPAVEFSEIYKKHNALNRLRIKLNFGPGLDDEMGVNYTKHNISPSKRIIGILNNELSDVIKTIRKEVEEKQRKEKEEEQRRKEEEQRRKEEEQRRKEKEQKEKEGRSGVEIDTSSLKPSFKTFDVNTKWTNEKDNLLDLSLSDNSVSIWYNGENKFYKDVLTEDENAAKLKNGYDVVLKALVASLVNNDIQTDTIKQVIMDISSALEESDCQNER